MELGRVEVRRKSGDESFHAAGRPLDFDLRAFWQWANSDLLSNAARGLLAEFLVARALGRGRDLRREWEPFDVLSADGLRVEVKSSAYLQTWSQRALSRIVFGIRPTFGWDEETSSLQTERRRQADVYVFALLACTDQTAVDPMDVNQWSFLALTTSRLNAELGEQKTATLARLRQIGALPCAYAELAATVRAAFERTPAAASCIPNPDL